MFPCELFNICMFMDWLRGFLGITGVWVADVLGLLILGYFGIDACVLRVWDLGLVFYGSFCVVGVVW